MGDEREEVGIYMVFWLCDIVIYNKYMFGLFLLAQSSLNAWNFLGGEKIKVSFVILIR